MTTLTEQLEQAVMALKQNQLIGYPTESVFGFGADPFNQQAVEKLQALKARPENSAFILIATSLTQIEKYIAVEDKTLLNKMLTADRPTTWICPASDAVPNWLLGPNNTIGFRITDFALCHQLCDLFGGPLISTSANFKGETPAKTFAQMQPFTDYLGYIVDAECGHATRPSTIKDLITDQVYRP